MPHRQLRQISRVAIMDDDPFFVSLVQDDFVALSLPIPEVYEVAKQLISDFVDTADEHSLLLLDLQLPGEDGLSVMAQLQSAHFNGTVLIISGFERRVLDLAVSVGQKSALRVLGYLPKPFSLEQLRAALCRPCGEQLCREETESDLQIDLSRLQPYFQPIYDLGLGEIIGFEMLSRIFTESGAMITPDVFLPILQNQQRLLAFHEVSLVKLCQVVAQAPKHVRFSYNLSPMQLEQADFVDFLLQTVGQHGIKPNQLKIELVEDAVISDALVVQRSLARLRLSGFDLVIDDYGSGYATLRHLMDCPCQELKIDRDYIQGCDKNPEQQAVIKSTVEMAHSLGIKVVAEGVETEHELLEVKRLGVDFVQGFYIGRPKPQLQLLPEFHCQS